MNRELLQQVLRAFEVATAPLAKDRMEISAAIELIQAELAKSMPEPDEIESLRAEVERLKQAQQWQPIESAPMDGNYFLGYNNHWRGVAKFFIHSDDTEPFLWVDETGEFITPTLTHWMPLPEPPTSGAMEKL